MNLSRTVRSTLDHASPSSLKTSQSIKDHWWSVYTWINVGGVMIEGDEKVVEGLVLHKSRLSQTVETLEQLQYFFFRLLNFESLRLGHKNEFL
jgi:hypothetical protein